MRYSCDADRGWIRYDVFLLAVLLQGDCTSPACNEEGPRGYAQPQNDCFEQRLADLAAELDKVIGPSRMPTWDDEASLLYIRAILKEVHRWAPIGSLGVPHATTKDDSYQGKQIPAGTVVFPNLTVLSRHHERYKNADIFNPDCFLGDDLDASSLALDSNYKKRDYFHYRFKRRLC
jgi:cytochrome P450